MDEAEARGALGALPAGALVEAQGSALRVYLRRDLVQADCDAMHDAFEAWNAAHLAAALPAARAHLAFDRARYAAPEEDLGDGLQPTWLGVEPSFSLDLQRAAEGDAARFAALVPAFLALMEAAITLRARRRSA